MSFRLLLPVCLAAAMIGAGCGEESRSSDSSKKESSQQREAAPSDDPKPAGDEQSPESEASRVVYDVLSAGNAKNFEEMCGLMTERMQTKVAAETPANDDCVQAATPTPGPKVSYEQFEKNLAKLAVDGDVATLHVPLGKINNEAILMEAIVRRVDGTWLLDDLKAA